MFFYYYLQSTIKIIGVTIITKQSGMVMIHKTNNTQNVPFKDNK